MSDTGNAVKDEMRYGASFLRRHGWRLSLVFLGLLLPLWAFAEIADEVREAEVIAFDAPVLGWARGWAHEGLDGLFVLISRLGYLHGVVPADIALVSILVLRRFHREATFAAVALAGSALLNLAAKQAYARARPSLWESIAPETNFSFPSGHAMGSMTLAAVCVLLAWHTRWRWPVTMSAVVFVVLVGLSRVYLGVHYPSDILAGWAAASLWTVAVFFAVYRHHLWPWGAVAAS